jgi:hypothetical protein
MGYGRQASLFGDPFDQQGLADKVRALSRQNIFIGTSSWRYEGWLGKIYTAERYYTRGRFSKKKFHEQCIAEYAETFPVVGGDFSFYVIPEPAFWKKLFEDAPAHFEMESEGAGRLHHKAFLQPATLWRSSRPAKPQFSGHRSL